MRLSFAIRMHTTWAAVLSILAGLSSRYAYAEADRLPAMSPEQPVSCYRGEDGTWVRLQCNQRTKRCLYAPNGILDQDDKPSKKLQRARYCARKDDPLNLDDLQRQGFTVKRGLADAPYGWMRDERGRVFQVNFDLKRRMYLGGGYGLEWTPDQGVTGRPSLDVGLLVMEKRIDDTRHRLRLVEGRLLLDPFNADIALFQYDFSHSYKNPALRITSFFGLPRRHDLRLDLGMWVQAGRVEYRSRDEEEERLWRILTINGTIDLWQSKDMYSFVRLRGGVGLERTSSNVATAREALTPGGALEADITFDRLGFHHMGLELSYERPYYTTADARIGEQAQRLHASLEYEVIFLAINDQPLSLHLQATAEKRDDSPLIDSRWAAKVNAGLRFSLWAPARSR